jgi:hypothetical protein
MRKKQREDIIGYIGLFITFVAAVLLILKVLGII